MLQTFLQDLRTKAACCETTSMVRVLLRDGTTAMALYRAMRLCQRLRLVPLAFLLHRMNACISHAVIGRGAEFGPGFVILHRMGIVINSHFPRDHHRTLA